LQEIDLEAFRKLVASNKSVTKAELSNVLQICKEHKPSSTITCKFYLMRCANNAFRDANLIDFMLGRLVGYVLQKKEYKNPTDVEIRDLWIKAKETFQRSVKSGEAGELLLFLLLEAEDIIQVFSKMDLKTSKNMPVHGCDAVHIQVGEAVMLHFGHSKMYASFADALGAALKDVKKFADKPLKDRELNLVSSRLDEVKFGQFAQTIQKLIHPYTERRDLYREVDSIFIGANWQFMKDIRKDNDDYAKSEYEKFTEQTASNVANKTLSVGEIKARTFLFLILPFEDVADFRAKFQKELSR
jgi:hypothetical protein